jgi:anti-sigma regulatory factor (Ser/Thr protein kinase)
VDESFGYQTFPDWTSPSTVDRNLDNTDRSILEIDEDGLGETWRWQTLHTVQEIDEVVGELLTSMQQMGYSVGEILAVRQAVIEAILNALEHGRGTEPGKQVRVRSLVTSACVAIEVHDEGPGFRPEDVRDPLASETLGRQRGHGLLLMRAYMNSVRFSDGGRCVTLCKQRR